MEREVAAHAQSNVLTQPLQCEGNVLISYLIKPYNVQ